MLLSVPLEALLLLPALAAFWSGCLDHSYCARAKEREGGGEVSDLTKEGRGRRTRATYLTRGGRSLLVLLSANVATARQRGSQVIQCLQRPVDEENGNVSESQYDAWRRGGSVARARVIDAPARGEGLTFSRGRRCPWKTWCRPFA